MDFVVGFVGWILKTLQKRVEEREEGVDGRKTRNGGVSREVYHGLLDILVSDVFRGSLVVLLSIKIGKFFPDVCTDRIVSILIAFDA